MYIQTINNEQFLTEPTIFFLLKKNTNIFILSCFYLQNNYMI